MSEAYASTLHISFDIRGGLLIRQIHHWAALLFVAVIAVHTLRMFFTGAFRKPHELNWLIGTAMFALAAFEGFAGYSLPDDLLSGTGLRIADGITLSLPIVGTYLCFSCSAASTPIVPRLYIIHVPLVPGLILALLTAHLMILWHQGHTQWPGRRQRDSNEVGDPLYPVFAAKATALFFAVFGALRLMPSWKTNFLGHTIEWGILIPGALLPAAFFVLIGGYPFAEQWLTGDRRSHQVLDRPRNTPARTGLGGAIVAMGVVIELGGADDVIAYRFGFSVFAVVWALRAGFFLLPTVAFIVTRRVCVALQRTDRRRARRGIEYGIAAQSLDGKGTAYSGVSRPLTEDGQAVLTTARPDQLYQPVPRHILPLPAPRRAAAQVRRNLLYVFSDTRAG